MIRGRREPSVFEIILVKRQRCTALRSVETQWCPSRGLWIGIFTRNGQEGKKREKGSVGPVGLTHTRDIRPQQRGNTTKGERTAEVLQSEDTKGRYIASAISSCGNPEPEALACPGVKTVFLLPMVMIQRYKTYDWVGIWSQRDHTHRHLVRDGDDDFILRRRSSKPIPFSFLYRCLLR